MRRIGFVSRINYWGMSADEKAFTYKEPVLTNTDRQQMLDYLDAVFGGTAYGFPDDREVFIDDELTETDTNGDWIYAAATHWDRDF